MSNKDLRVKLESVILPEAIIEQIRVAISQEDNGEQIFDTWGFGEVFEKGTAVTLLFYGIPGTGKTLMAQAIADSLGYKLKIVTTADIESMEPGGAERTIREVFKEARKLLGGKKTVLLFDECDSLLVSRNEVGSIIGAQVNALLTEIERHTGIVILTTNRLGTLDPALERRIGAKIEFPFPDAPARLSIWQRMIPQKAPLAKDVDLPHLAKEYPLTGGAIKNAVLNAARRAAYFKKKKIEMADFEQAVRDEIQSSLEFSEAYASHRPVPRQSGIGAMRDKVRTIGGSFLKG